MDPYHGTVTMTEIADDIFVLDDGDSGAFGSLMTMSEDDDLPPGPTGGSGSPGTNSPPPAPPDIRNYAKYSQQIFSLLDTNSVLNDDNNTNLYNACAAMPVDTNTIPLLFIQPYGANAVIIRADNFDYSETNADFALLICDKVQSPTWKTIDFSGASDTQDGWLVQGTVPNWKVTSTMFMLVTNLNTPYNAFFQAVPYSGPQVAIIGTNSPYDVVSNTITFTTQVVDLSGTTNEQLEVNIDGYPCRYSFGSSNTFTVDTTYSPSGTCNVYLEAMGTSSVNDPANPPPVDTELAFLGLTSIPLDFENPTYLLFQSDYASPDVGTNYIEFVISKAQDCAAIISDPLDGHVIWAATNYFSSPGPIAIPWNFTEADGVTPYTNDTYAVQIIAFDPQSFFFTNHIDFAQVRHGAGTYLAYEEEPANTTTGIYLNSEAANWTATEQELFNDIYLYFGLTEYTTGQVGDNRNYSATGYQSAITPGWDTFLKPALQATYATNACTYSDLTIAQAHGSGSTIGGANSVSTNDFNTLDLGLWVAGAPHPNWRLRKAALWACYSSSYKGRESMTTPYPGFPTACGIRDKGLQEISFMRKNCGLFFNGLLPQGGFGGNTSVVTAHVAAFLDQTWVCGANQYPGGCDPTYSFRFAVNATRGVYNPQMDYAGPLLFGLGQMIYSSVYDDELLMLNYSDVKSP